MPPSSWPQSRANDVAAHAKLSPSSAERWLTCPGSIGLTDQAFPNGLEDEGSVYAKEGTWAHEVAELYGKQQMGLLTAKQYKTQYKWVKTEVEKEGFDFDAMVEYATGYAELIQEIVDANPGKKPLTMFENRVHPSVPEVWGTADCILVVGGELYVIDYKYGKGIQVAAEENPQLKLYALGALNLVEETMGDLLGDLDQVHALIYQPRTSSNPEWHTYDRQELEVWQSTYAVPQAQKALSGSAEVVPSDAACRWCPVAGLCIPRKEQLIDRDFGEPKLLSPADLADALSSLKDIEGWCSQVRDVALELAYRQGVEIPDWKVVRARANRKIYDKPAAITTLVEAGYDQDRVQRVDTETLSKLDKLVGGKDVLSDLLGDLIGTPEGKETLVPKSDPRSDITQLSDAVAEFDDLPVTDK